MAVKRILRYLKGTAALGLALGGSQTPLEVVGYVDADWGGNLDDRTSTSGGIFKLGTGPIVWHSKKQSSTALSSTEAEYMALTLGCKDAIWLRMLLKDLDRAVKEPITIFEDNQGALALVRNPTYHARTKHIDVRYHFVREVVESKQVELRYCRTNDMVADACTKALPAHKLAEHRLAMGLKEIQSTR
jgi:hypothetical protein